MLTSIIHRFTHSSLSCLVFLTKSNKTINITGSRQQTETLHHMSETIKLLYREVHRFFFSNSEYCKILDMKLQIVTVNVSLFVVFETVEQYFSFLINFFILLKMLTHFAAN